MNTLTYLGESHGFSAYQNSEGFIELFKQKGKEKNFIEVSNGTGIERIVTQFRDLKDVIIPKRKRTKPYDPYTDEKQMQII